MRKLLFHKQNFIVFVLKVDEEVSKVVWAVLQWFQICSGLKINFDKSELMGVNVEHR